MNPFLCNYQITNVSFVLKWNFTYFTFIYCNIFAFRIHSITRNGVFGNSISACRKTCNSESVTAVQLELRNRAVCQESIITCPAHTFDSGVGWLIFYSEINIIIVSNSITIVNPHLFNFSWTNITSVSHKLHNRRIITYTYFWLHNSTNFGRRTSIIANSLLFYIISACR